MRHSSVCSSDPRWMWHCLSAAVVPQLMVLLWLLSSAMHVTPGLLPVHRCWWDGSLTGPAAAPDMLLIYNAQLWQRNQRCLYAKPAGAKTWWEMRNVTLSPSLSLYSKLTHTWCSDCILMIHIAVEPTCCCAVCNGGGCRDTTSHGTVRPDDMKYILIMIWRWGSGRPNCFRNR